MNHRHMQSLLQALAATLGLGGVAWGDPAERGPPRRLVLVRFARARPRAAADTGATRVSLHVIDWPVKGRNARWKARHAVMAAAEAVKTRVGASGPLARALGRLRDAR